MQRFFSILLFLAITLSVAACGKGDGKGSVLRGDHKGIYNDLIRTFEKLIQA